MPALQHLVVMGVSGSGKTTVGLALAAALGRDFAEGDDFHPPANVAKMAAGTPLDDDDRGPWLDAIGGWLAARSEPAVVSCSALKRAYRDRLRGFAPGILFVHLVVDPATVRARVAGREGHFMPASLVGSQFEALEPLGADEPGIAVDASLPVGEIVARVTAAS